jgi:hypothetical protein
MLVLSPHLDSSSIFTLVMDPPSSGSGTAADTDSTTTRGFYLRGADGNIVEMACCLDGIHPSMHVVQ